MQQPSVLTAISRDNPYYMGVRAHDDSGGMCRDTSSPIISNNTGDKVSPMVKVES